METLYLLVKNIIVIIVVAAVLEMLVPAGSFKSIVGFVIGLFVLISILQPILTLILHKQPITFNGWDMENVSPVQEKDMLNKSESFRRQLYSEGRQESARKMEQQIEALTALVPGVLKTDTAVTLSETTGEISRVQVEVILEETGVVELVKPVALGQVAYEPVEFKRGQQVAVKLQELIHSFYDIPMEKIWIECQGGGKG